MLRAFPVHATRHAADLAGVWDFAFLGDVAVDSVPPDSIRFTDQMAVPACFDAIPAYAGKRGLAAYRTRIRLVDSSRHRLIFGAVHHYCRVYLDGHLLGEHSNGFTQFHFDITGVPAGEHDLVVLVDNRFDAARAPLHVDYADWYHYGGITRGVELHRLGAQWIDAIEIETLDLASRRIRVRTRYAADAAATVPFAIHVNGRELVSKQLAVAPGGGVIDHELTLTSAAVWSPESRTLHDIAVRLGSDDMRDRFGLRTVRVAGTQILLNDEPITLRGVNRHEAHPELGSALPPSIMAYDLSILRDMHCNFVRGAHYPQDPIFLDLCDAAGMLVWCETIGWQYNDAHLSDVHFVDHLVAHTREMVAQSRNHPSVIMWGLINEADSDKEGSRLGFERTIATLRELDASRPVTYASHKRLADLFFHLVDIVSVNIYPGWYWGEVGEVASDIAKHIAEIDARAAALGAAGKPLIISEIGADAVPGYRDWNEDRWSEQYQAQLVEATIGEVLKPNSRACGLAIWQFCDMRTSRRLPRILGKPAGFNMKGLVDAHRRPKLAYDVTKRLYAGLANGVKA